MKSYTDIEQSKKLVEILPLESADMYYFTIIRDYPYSQGKIKTIVKIMDNSFSSNYDTPCWSLAALLSFLPKIHKLKPILDLEENSIQYSGVDLYVIGENPIDACYEMIIRLHELKML